MPKMLQSGQSPVQSSPMMNTKPAMSAMDYLGRIKGMQDQQQQASRAQFNQQNAQNAIQAMQPGAKAQSPIVGPTQMSDSQRMAAILSQMR